MSLAVDASALVAIVLGEPEAAGFYDALLLAGGGVISPVNLWEAAVRVRTRKMESGLIALRGLLAELRIRVAPITEDQAWAAVSASARYGRGTPADLNLGDCFAYVLAQSEGLALLYKGADFSRTDVRSAL